MVCFHHTKIKALVLVTDNLEHFAEFAWIMCIIFLSFDGCHNININKMAK